MHYLCTVKPVLRGHSKRRAKLFFKTDYRLMQVKVCRMLPLEHSAIRSTFIKLLFAIKTFVLSIFEWPLKTGFTVSIMYLVVWPMLFSLIFAAV